MTTSTPRRNRSQITTSAPEIAEAAETVAAAEVSQRRHWVGFGKDLAARIGPRNDLSPEEILPLLSKLPTWPDPARSEHWRRAGRGVSSVLAWLRTHPGEGWQERWLASGADQDLGWLSVIPAESAKAPITKKGTNSYGLFFLLLGKVVVPSYDFTRIYGCQVLFGRYRQVWWSNELVARIDTAAAEFGMHRGSQAEGVRVLTKITLCTGLELDQLTTEHFHQYREWTTSGGAAQRAGSGQLGI